MQPRRYGGCFAEMAMSTAILNTEVAATPVGGTSGAYEHEFDATGFGPNGGPTRRASFNLRRPKRVVTR